MTAFMNEHVYPAESVFEQQIAELDDPWAWSRAPVIKQLQSEARSAWLMDIKGNNAAHTDIHATWRTDCATGADTYEWLAAARDCDEAAWTRLLHYNEDGEPRSLNRRVVRRVGPDRDGGGPGLHPVRFRRDAAKGSPARG